MGMRVALAIFKTNCSWQRRRRAESAGEFTVDHEVRDQRGCGTRSCPRFRRREVSARDAVFVVPERKPTYQPLIRGHSATTPQPRSTTKYRSCAAAVGQAWLGRIRTRAPMGKASGGRGCSLTTRPCSCQTFPGSLACDQSQFMRGRGRPRPRVLRSSPQEPGTRSAPPLRYET